MSKNLDDMKCENEEYKKKYKKAVTSKKEVRKAEEVKK